MKLNNITQIRSEDYEDEFQDLVSRMGGTLNSFMQEVVELADKRINFDNKEESLLSFEVTVASSGTPDVTRVNTRKIGNISGCQVINAINLTNASGYATSQPFISFQPIGNGFIQINNITGLRSGDKYRLTVIIY
jgi:hypothetical protein